MGPQFPTAVLAEGRIPVMPLGGARGARSFRDRLSKYTLGTLEPVSVMDDALNLSSFEEPVEQLDGMKDRNARPVDQGTGPDLHQASRITRRHILDTGLLHLGELAT
jgi:hypothetical protein